MPEKIFWDTWAFITLANRRDTNYLLAKRVRETLEQQQTFMVTTEAVLTELGNAFSKRHLRQFALQQLASVRIVVNQGAGQIVNVDTTLWERAWQLYQQRPDKDWGHTDCISFVVMQDLGITKAFTGDHHFEQAGFTQLVKI